MIKLHKVLPADDLELGPDYEIIKEIGKGSYGIVYQAIHKPTNTKVAIKKMINVFDDKIDCKRILREIILLKLLKHPNIVKLIEILEPKDKQNFNYLYVVLEYCQSDIKKLVKSAIHLTMDHVQSIIYSLLMTLKYIHNSNVLHRDLKPANVLINEDCSIKVCDFGLARSNAGIENPGIMIVKNLQMKGEETVASGDEDAKINDSIPSLISRKDSTENEGNENHLEEEKKKEIVKKLTKTKDYRRNLKRKLTGHVVTRWYRAPELILLEKDYGPAIDIWSVGCIFAELLSMIKENASTYCERKPLFPGTSCFPLSPDNKASVKKMGFPHSQTDQLNVIFDVIGTPNEDDYSFVTDTKALEYLKTFTSRPKADFQKLYIATSSLAIDLLSKMLLFNPFFRISVNDALKHPFFKGVIYNHPEFKCEKKIHLEFENEEKLDECKLRKLFVNEIMHFTTLRKTGEDYFSKISKKK